MNGKPKRIARKLGESSKRMAKRPKRERNNTHRYGDVEKTNYDEFFTANGVNNDIFTISVDDKRTVQSSTNNSNVKISTESVETEHNQMLLETVTKMSATIKFLREKVDGLTNELRQLQNTSSLNILNGDVEDQDVQNLQRLENFKLPIDDHNHLKNLDDILKQDRSFYLFFVRFFCMTFS